MKLMENVFLTVIACLLLITGCGKKEEAPKETTGMNAGTHIEWDYNTLKKVSGGSTERYCGYSRMIQLHDQSLLAIYEASGNVVCVKSTDFGATWSAPVSVAAGADGINMAVPDILQLKDHSLLACYNPRPREISPS